MRRFGLIGFPLSHSFSKHYFSEKFAREHIPDCSYDLYPIEQIDVLPQLLSSTENLCGLNVTIPYKKQVLAYLHEATPAVLAMQACNCISIVEGKLYGFNTDVVGFEKTFARQLTPDDSAALILGTGGAAAAVAYTLDKLGIMYMFVGRRPSGRSNEITYTDLDQAILSKHTAIINTTPLGTYPGVDECPDLPYQLISSRHYLYDLVYNPPKTLFLQKGEERGARVQNGAAMLAIQAEESWKIWNSR